MWINSSMAYPTSFWMLTVGGFLITGIDFIGIWVLFQNIDTLGGFSLPQVAFLYGGTGVALAIADLLVGRIERLGSMVRLGKLDVMMVRPVPLILQVCADEFALRRLARVAQSGLVLGWAAGSVDWSLPKIAVTASMVLSGSVIFSAIFIGFACIQFWAADSAEVANAFTYGGNQLTQVPLTVFPAEVIKALTFGLPLAFVNWYPSLYVLGIPDPFGYPDATQFLSPVAALVTAGIAAATWRTGVRHYRSTGS
jgi:ABC-2 type transport system permease protein